MKGIPCCTRFVVPMLGTLLFACAAFGATNEAVLYSFQGGADGFNPESGLVADASGNLYGSTNGQNGSNRGTVFELAAPSQVDGKWTETVLYDFGGINDGSQPIGNLIFDANGNLYGVTQSGGTQNSGTVYELSPPSQPGGLWTETVLYNFLGKSDGAGPSAGLVFDALGNLYGTTFGGGTSSCDCGTVYELSPPQQSGNSWTKITLHTFSGSLPRGTDGAQPNSSLIIDSRGDLFGTTESGGSAANIGTFFVLRQSDGAWHENVLYAFSSAFGGNPNGGLVVYHGNFYGTDSNYGGHQFGTIFEISPPSGGRNWSVTALYSFAGGNDADPFGPMAVDSAGNLYGTALGDRQHQDYGSVFKLSPGPGGSWTETTVYNFKGDPDGQYPYSGLIFGKAGALYGTTQYGGASNYGAVFGILP
ncbi:MAG: choice-of-anchor tandem repeat GloVer-containing protein [Terriglobales bacterium]